MARYACAVHQKYFTFRIDEYAGWLAICDTSNNNIDSNKNNKLNKIEIEFSDSN